MNLLAPAIETQHLSRVFTGTRKGAKKGSPEQNVTALSDVSLEVQKGELFGLLGPNGAGKTTLIKILCNLLLPTTGKAFVHGLDVTRDEARIRRLINMVSGGEHSGYGLLTVRENLWLFSQFYGVSNPVAKERIDRMLGVVGLARHAHLKVHKLSTGMRQKMNFARGFTNDPELLFLDEPTLGLDVESSRDIRKYMKRWVSENANKTILLTTHDMREAEELCSRVAIINDGRIMACDSPLNLRALVSREITVELDVRMSSNGWRELEKLSGVTQLISSAGADPDISHLKFHLTDEAPMSGIFAHLIHNGSEILRVQKTEPDLEDVFIKLVGRSLKED
ncbi:MAG: ABC transporter ATP-binding protein [Armatimonadetes bacterium]|nr:ABC transporter ATP-binding protein [Armatimonadota bacterium]